MASFLAMDPMSLKTGEMMPGVRNIATISVRTTILLKKNWARPIGPIFVTVGRKLFDQNDVEFDFRISHVLVIFPFS